MEFESVLKLPEGSFRAILLQGYPTWEGWGNPLPSDPCPPDGGMSRGHCPPHQAILKIFGALRVHFQTYVLNFLQI